MATPRSVLEAHRPDPLVAACAALAVLGAVLSLAGLATSASWWIPVAFASALFAAARAVARR